MAITLNKGQKSARALIKDKTNKFILLRGGTGSGKTYVAMDSIIHRAMIAPGSNHLCLRSTATDARSTLFEMTTRSVLEAKFRNSEGGSIWELMRKRGIITLDPMMIKFENNSTIRFAGLDDNNTDRVLGADYATIFINEVSLIDQFSLIQKLRTRLRQKVQNDAGNDLSLKFIFDCNPPSERHWTYAAFSLGLNPETGNPHNKPDEWVALKMFGKDNKANLADGYLDDLTDLSYIDHMRFVEGDWYKDVDNPMFFSGDIAKTRLAPILPGQMEFDRIEVAIDPAVSNTPGADETGIIVVARDDNDHAYVLQDLSGKYTPVQWAEVAATAFHRWQADAVVAEKNQGGDMVSANLWSYDNNLPVKLVHASRGKDIRAEGSATAFSQHRVHMCGSFEKLEAQLLDFEVGFNRRLKGSPDRLDALVHGLNSILLMETKSKGVVAKQMTGFWS